MYVVFAVHRWSAMGVECNRCGATGAPADPSTGSAGYLLIFGRREDAERYSNSHAKGPFQIAEVETL